VFHTWICFRFCNICMHTYICVCTLFCASTHLTHSTWKVIYNILSAPVFWIATIVTWSQVWDFPIKSELEMLGFWRISDFKFSDYWAWDPEFNCQYSSKTRSGCSPELLLFVHSTVWFWKLNSDHLCPPRPSTQCGEPSGTQWRHLASHPVKLSAIIIVFQFQWKTLDCFRQIVIFSL
jgi:hypothetical protein